MTGSAADLLVQRLTQYMGAAGATSTVNTFCRSTLKVAPESLTRQQLPLVLPSFKPLLSILLGTAKADAFLQQLSAELKS